MWLVLCDPNDRAALWAYAGLREHGLTPLELISPQTLICSTWSAHRIDKEGASFEIGLPDGRTLVSGDIKGALNRLLYVPVEHLAFASQADTCYAIEELSALMLSWLACIAPVTVNRPDARGLSGAWRLPAEWTMLAAKAGLPVSPLPLSSRTIAKPHTYTTTRTILVLGEHIFGGELASDLARACRRLARLADADLLGIDLHLDDRHQTRFVGATPLPDLRIGGSAFIERLYGHLTSLSVRSG